MLQQQLGRRNLTDVTRVEIALKLKPLLEKQAKERQGTRTDLPQNSAEGFSPKETRQELANLAGVSHDTVSKVETLLDQAAPDVIQASRTKDLSVSAALPLVDLPKPKQAAALLKTIPKGEHAAINALLDEPGIPGEEGLAMLRTLPDEPP